MNKANGTPSAEKKTPRLKWRTLNWLRRKRFLLEIGLFLFVAAVIYLWPMIFITIQSGERGVLYRRFTGTVLEQEPLREGLHIIPPWDIIYIYNIRQQHTRHTFHVLSRDGLRVDITISIRQHPRRKGTDLNYLHEYLGPNYLQNVIVPEIEAALRFIVGKYEPEELYQMEYGFLDAALTEALRQLEDLYVVLDDLLITNIELPPLVKSSIEAKLLEFHNAEKYQYLLMQAKEEAKRKVILATGIRDFQDIVSEGISHELLKWRGIEATLELAKSTNPKVVIIGSSEKGVPLILNTGDAASISHATSTESIRHATGEALPSPFAKTTEGQNLGLFDQVGNTAMDLTRLSQPSMK
ncbi:hypothetical protein GF373_01210 [bacterium]|nr:hypothetical protein [bacterium]